VEVAGVVVERGVKEGEEEGPPFISGGREKFDI
jgi:hypothetical protein